MGSRCKYRVRIYGLDFNFEDGINAINFAEMAEGHFVPGEYIKELDITLRVVSEDIEDVKEESNNEDDE